MAEGGIHWLTYASAREDRLLGPCQARDAAAALEIIGALQTPRFGYRYKGAIVNYPGDRSMIIPFDDGFLSEHDLLLLTTRPPMHDADTEKRKPRKTTRRSYTALECKLFDGPLARWVAYCTRVEVRLQPEAARVTPEIAARLCARFRQNGGPAYKELRSAAGSKTPFRRRPALTAAYLVWAEHAWPGGPALLAVWGLGANETLAWCRHLGTRLDGLLCNTEFAMAEMHTIDPPDRAQVSFFDSWNVHLLGCAPLQRPPGAPWSPGNGNGNGNQPSPPM